MPAKLYPATLLQKISIFLSVQCVLTVNILAVTNFQNKNEQPVNFNAVNDAKYTRSNPVNIIIGSQFSATMRSGLQCQRPQSFGDSLLICSFQLSQLLLCGG